MKVQKKEGPVLSLEEYTDFFRVRNSLNLTVIQLNEIIHMHGCAKVRRNKMDVMDALEPLDVMNPARLTLGEPGGVSCLAPLALDQVKADFADIGWEECPISSLVWTAPLEEADAAANAKALVCASSSSAPKKRKNRASGGGRAGRGKGAKPLGRPPRRPLLLSVVPVPLLTYA